MDEDDYDIDYESYESESEEDNFEFENLYYNAKAKKDDSLKEAIQDFESLIEIESSTENLDDYSFGFKARKQICKCLFKMKEFEKFLGGYQKILSSKSKPGLQKKYFEESIKKILKYVSNKNSNTPPEIQLKFHQLTLENLQLKPSDKLWFQHKMKIAQLRLGCGEYEESEKIIENLLEFTEIGVQERKEKDNCKDKTKNKDKDKEKEKEPPTVSKPPLFNSSQLLQIFSLEIQLYTNLKNFTKLQKIYNRTKSSIQHFDFCSVFDQGIIKELSGKINLKNLNYNNAYTDFFEAFKSFDECSHEKRFLALKFNVLSAMLYESDINPFDSQEAKNYRSSEKLAGIIKLHEAYGRLDTVSFDRIFEEEFLDVKGADSEDELLIYFMKRLQVHLWHKKLTIFLKSQNSKNSNSEIPISSFSEALHLDNAVVEKLLIYAISERDLKGKLDIQRGVLVLEKEETEPLDVQRIALEKMLDQQVKQGMRVLEEIRIDR